jgi:hypothetical protein
MNTFNQESFKVCEPNHRTLPVIALGNAALNPAWHPRNSDKRTLEQRSIERWENEGGEIPSERRKRTQFIKSKSLHRSAFHQFLKAIST